MIEVSSGRPEAPDAVYPPWDRVEPIDIYKWKLARANKEQRALQSKMLTHKRADGTPLYKLTSGSNLSRTDPLSSGTRKRVIERDKVCVWCGAGSPFEVDHIIRYVDGGSNDEENLQTLCEPCHRSKGGQ